MPILLALTVVTGLVDAASVLGLGRVFTANMTGNVVFLGFAVAGAPGLLVRPVDRALVAFLSAPSSADASASPRGRLHGAAASRSAFVEAGPAPGRRTGSPSGDLDPATPVRGLYAVIALTGRRDGHPECRRAAGWRSPT